MLTNRSGYNTTANTNVTGAPEYIFTSLLKFLSVGLNG